MKYKHYHALVLCSRLFTHVLLRSVCLLWSRDNQMRETVLYRRIYKYWNKITIPQLKEIFVYRNLHNYTKFKHYNRHPVYYLDYPDTNYHDLIVPVAEIARFGYRRRLEQGDSCVVISNSSLPITTQEKVSWVSVEEEYKPENIYSELQLRKRFLSNIISNLMVLVPGSSFCQEANSAASRENLK